MNRVFSFLLVTIVFLGIAARAFAQEFPIALEISETVVDFNTKKKLEGVTVTVYEKRDDGNLEEYAKTVTEKKGYMSSQLYLQKEYIVVFQKKGYVKKKILLDTRMDGIDEDFYEHDNILYLTNKINPGEEDPSLLDKPVVKVYFSKAAKGFVFDSLYTIAIKKEIEAIPKDLLDGLVKIQNEKAEEDPQNPVTPDPVKDNSIAEYLAKIEKERQERIAQAKADSLAKVLAWQKHIKDSIDEVNRITWQKHIDDSLLAVAYQKHIDDSIKNRRPPPVYVARPIPNYTVAPQTPASGGNEVEELPITGKVEVLVMKLQDEIFAEKSGTISESNASKAVKLAIEKEKMDNMNAKYKTGSPFISLLDEIDYYAKAQRNKTMKP